jgi:hypothetical protein
MVKAGVAVETPEERMYNEKGEEVTDENLMYGRPTKYKMLIPQNVQFVDNIGCNTNQKTNGHIGGELFVLLSNAVESGV